MLSAKILRAKHRKLEVKAQKSIRTSHRLMAMLALLAVDKSSISISPKKSLHGLLFCALFYVFQFEASRTPRFKLEKICAKEYQYL
jgi:hypothetical protein